VNLFEFPLLADENIHPDVIAYLRLDGLDVTSISEQGHFGLSDVKVLRQAFRAGRIVLTHDSDFGSLALMGAEFVGIRYLRPGHIRAEFTVQMLQAIRDREVDVTPPFIVVAERTGENVKIRIRKL
jgi:predicted nuclease of predicted toxin-antitoxin system